MPRNRSLPPHLEIRRSGYYWRRRLPRSLRDRGAMPCADLDKGICTPSKKSFLCFSLRTDVPANAKTLARRLTEMSDLVFAADAETMMAIAHETQVWMLESLARFEIEAFERARAVAGPRSPENAAIDLRREEALQPRHATSEQSHSDHLESRPRTEDRKSPAAPFRHGPDRGSGRPTVDRPRNRDRGRDRPRSLAAPPTSCRHCGAGNPWRPVRQEGSGHRTVSCSW